jgi:hypothetical protein
VIVIESNPMRGDIRDDGSWNVSPAIPNTPVLDSMLRPDIASGFNKPSADDIPSRDDMPRFDSLDVSVSLRGLNNPSVNGGSAVWNDKHHPNWVGYCVH